MEKKLNNVLYAVTRHGANPNGDGRDALIDIYLERYPDSEGEGLSIMSGPDLNDPAALAGMLKAGNDTDMVVVILDHELVPCKTGPGPDGIQAVIDILETNIREGYGQTSWEALEQSIREGRSEKKGG